MTITALGVTGMLLLSGCSISFGDQDSAEDEQRTTSAVMSRSVVDALLPAGQVPTGSIAFVADADDPIFGEGVEVNAAAGDQQFDFASVEIQKDPATRDGDAVMGRITFELAEDSLPVEFTHVQVSVPDARPASILVGEWRIGMAGEEAAQGPLQAGGSETISVTQCAPISLDVVNNGEEPLNDIVLAPSSPVLEVADTQVPSRIEPGESATLTMGFTCDAEVAEFFTFTPQVTYTSDGSERTLLTRPVLVEVADSADVLFGKLRNQQ